VTISSIKLHSLLKLKALPPERRALSEQSLIAFFPVLHSHLCLVLFILCIASLFSSVVQLCFCGCGIKVERPPDLRSALVAHPHVRYSIG
jgi:hypothetical protein